MSKNTLTTDAHTSTARLIGIQFSMMSADEIRRSSVALINNRNMYSSGSIPALGGLADPRMGTQEQSLLCPTDNLDHVNCPGYHGHIELAVPIFYVQYLDDIIRWSNCVCCNCSKLLISKTKYQKILENKAAKKRWDIVVKACKKVKHCGEDTEDGCQAPQPTAIRKEGLATIIAEWTVKDPAGATDKDTKTISIKWTPEILYKRFMRISDDDVNFAGFNSVFSRPENMICHNLLVPPPATRPSVKQDAQQRSEDDLTHILMNIIRVNNELLQDIQKNAAAKIIEDHTSILQFFAATLVNNSMPGVDALRNRASRPYKSISSRLGAKAGRMRGNLMAKRVDYSGRSVITGEPNLSIEELGVPMPIAMNLTVPVTVTESNREFLTQLVRAGPDVYPGAKIIKRAGSNYTITLQYMDRESIILEPGDEVHRHLLNGDMVLFNRQPTLHRMSMQSFKARIMKRGNTFRFNVGVAKPFNADYDGDEMNAHVPQNVLAAVELRLLSAVPYQIISPANHGPIIGPVQDNLLGAYIFTGDNVRFNLQQAMNLLMTCPTVDVAKLTTAYKSKKHVTSFDILSQITPPISLKYKTKGFNEEKEDAKTSNNVLEIRNGEYVRGRMDKGVLSGGSKSLVQRITNDYSNIQCVRYIDNLQNIVTQFMKTHSFSVGISDLISNTKTTQDIARIINGKRAEVKDIIDQIMMGTFINNTGRNNNDEFENQVVTILSQASGDAGKVALDSLGAGNRFVTMVKAGSKGNENNIAFMTSCLGQQTVEGKRIPDGFQNRTLPHFPKYDEGAASRGFVTNSYVTGLSPTDLFYHAMAGRVGLIDTAVKSVTWETPIILIENGTPVYTEIGRWIDGKLEAAYVADASTVEKYTERNMELLKTEACGLYIPTTDDDGRVSWGEITAITRHDPGDILYEVTTASGRTVTVTESKSLIVWDEERRQFLEKPTPDIKTGDYLPVTYQLPMFEASQYKHLGKSEGIVDGALFSTMGTLTHIRALVDTITCPIDYIKGFCASYLNNKCINFMPNYNLVLFIDIPLNEESDFHIINMMLMRLNLLSTCDIENTDGVCCMQFACCDVYELFDEFNIEHPEVPITPVNRKKQHNDVVLDPISEIRIISVEAHPKVYDLTIPSTLNFGLANGLQVRDTSSTGYIQRRLIKGLEDCMVRYDHTVRSNKGKIIQFSYGDDNIDPMKVETQNLPLLGMSIADIYNYYNFPDMGDKATTKTLSAIFIKSAMATFKKQAEETIKKCQEHTQAAIAARDDIIKHVFRGRDDNAVNCPVAFMYIISNIQGQMGINQYSMVDITPLEVFTMLESAMSDLEKIRTAPPTALFKVLYNYYLAPKDLLLIKRFNRAAIVRLLDTVKLAYKQAIVAPGEMVGPVAAQSIGEVSTQLTLNTFHHINVLSKTNATRGVPRIDEILSLSKNIKSPSLTVYLKQDDRTHKDRAQDIMYKMEHTTLGELVKTTAIYFDPDDMNTIIDEDRPLMAQYKEFETMIGECANINLANSNISKSKWLLRMEMDPAAMLEKNITMDDIHFTVNNIYKDQISCVFSDYNADKLVFRVRMTEVIKQNASKTAVNKKPLNQFDQIYILKNFQDNLLQNVVIRGVKGIKKVAMRKVKNQLVEHNGSYVTQDQWVLDTTGSNLLEVLGLNYIDKTKTFSNDIIETFNVLGIEAARQTIFNEFVDVIKFDGTNIDYHHFCLLCDRMCYNGDLISIYRHGIKNDDIGVLAKASFEETAEMFMNAAKHGELDVMTGVSANVMCGQEGMYGTNAFRILIDMAEISKLKPAAEYKRDDRERELAEMFKSGAIAAEADECGVKHLAVQNGVINIAGADMGEQNDDYTPF